MAFAFERVQETPRDHMVTPYFRHQTVEDVLASEREKRPVMTTVEAVEMRIAGEKNYVAVVPADSMWQTVNGIPMTYAERFAEQYRAFKLGAAQESSGTPLEQLAPYGITPAQLSLCRALRVHSIEALSAMEGNNLKALGMSGNDLKRMAEAYMADRAEGNAAQRQIANMQAEIDRLRAEAAASAIMTEAAAEEVVAESQFAAMTEAQLKDYIRNRTGSAPRGTPSRDILLRMAEEA
mgnify:CR=1 FL=1